MISKLTTWVIRNAIPTVNAKAVNPTDIALTITGDSIIKNNKPTESKVINLTVAHLKAIAETEGAKLSFDDKTNEVTIVRSEGKRGRKPRSATPTTKRNEFLKGFGL